MSLISLIKQYALNEVESGDFGAALQALESAQTYWVNPNGVTLADVGLKISVEAQAIVSETLRKIDSGELSLPEPHTAKRGLISDARSALTLPTGLLLGQQDRQDLIGLIGTVGGWSPELIGAVQSLGRKQVSVLEGAGYSNMTAAGIQATWNNYRVQQFRQQWIDIVGQVESIISGADFEKAQSIIAATQSALEV